MPDLTTRKLLLHAVTLDEAEALYEGRPLPAWPYAPGYPLEDTKDGVNFFICHQVQDFGFYLAVRRDDGLVIGEIGFMAPPKEGMVTIGFAIVPSARRQGYATEAIVAIANWALAHPDVAEVRAQTRPDNEPSTRALLRAGFSEVDSAENQRCFRLRAG